MMASGRGDDSIVPGLELDRYRCQIELDEPYRNESGGSLSSAERTAIVTRLLDWLVHHERLADIGALPASYESRRRMLRGLLNVRPPRPLDDAFLHDINRLLLDETNCRDIVNGSDLPTVSDTIPLCRLKNPGRLVLWKGDILRLKADAIVNAANDQLLGCFQPLHNCIDNVIHSAAGPLLRQDCQSIMKIQRQREQTGDAKITRAYNLPSQFVLHTVGPIIGSGDVSAFQRHQLASCYRNCLALANQLPGIRSIAFPCISTGVFNFPGEMASEIAILTVSDWLSCNHHHFDRVIFNVYLQEDFDGYTQAFQHCSD